MHLADGDVVGVEQVVIVLIEARVVRQVRLENETFEKPRDMREVPLRRADIGHRLYNRVFRLQVGNK